MKLLETYSQDIKLTRKFKPCAPLAFRWVVIGAYLLIVLSAMVWGAVSINASRVDLKKKQQLSENADITRAISRERSQTLQTQQAKIDFDSYQQWLRQNHSMTQMLNVMFAALPENARLREMELGQQSGQRFSMVLNVFPVSDGSAISFEGFISKLSTVGIALEETAQSVADGIELSCAFNLPNRFYPALAPKGAQPPMIAKPVETEEGGDSL